MNSATPGGWVKEDAVTHLDGGATTSDLLVDAIESLGFDIIKLKVRIESTGNPVGVLHVGIKDANGFQAMAVYQCAVSDPAALTFSPGAPGITVNDPAADAYITVWVEAPCGESISLFWDSTSGGDADGMDVTYQRWARTRGANA